ncbi:MAG: flagellar assembly protein FliH [Pseudomonadota bacterium]|nr:flagellar assembly protein FliH [Pseudomonadota bacterium]
MTSSKFRNVPPPEGGGKGSVYSRFIPREELSSFEAWNPDALSGSAAAPAGTGMPAEEAVIPPAEALAAQLRAARQSGYQDGYRDGLSALDGFKQTFASQITAQLGRLMESHAAQLDGLQQQLAQAVAVCATSMARQVVRSELAVRPELVAAVAQEAVETLLLSARHITLRVHPDDQPLVVQGAAEVLHARGARVIGDPSIARGGCRVDSDIASVDGTVPARWRRASAALGTESEWTHEPDVGDELPPDPDRPTEEDLP